MRITLLINELNVRGGTHKQFLRLCQYLKRENVDFEIITKYYDMNKTYPGFKEFEIKSIRKENYKNNKNKYIRFIKNIIDTLRLLLLISYKSKVYNIHDNGLSFLFPILKILRKNLVWQVNDLPSFFSEGNAKGDLISMEKKIMAKFFKHITVKCVNSVVVNVSKNAQRIKKHFNIEAYVFHCGVDKLDNFEIHQYKNKKKINLLSTGVFFPYRNYEVLIDVTNKLNDEGYDCNLDIIGETSWDLNYSNKIYRLIEKSPYKAKFLIHGQVDEKKFKSLFDQSDIFLFVNIDQSWGLVVFESMSVGIPTIVSDSVGAIEILNEDVSIIVDPKNSDSIKNEITALINNEKHYNKYSKNGYNHVSEMTWDQMYSSKMYNLFISDLEN